AGQAGLAGAGRPPEHVAAVVRDAEPGVLAVDVTEGAHVVDDPLQLTLPQDDAVDVSLGDPRGPLPAAVAVGDEQAHPRLLDLPGGVQAVEQLDDGVTPGGGLGVDADGLHRLDPTGGPVVLALEAVVALV